MFAGIEKSFLVRYALGTLWAIALVVAPLSAPGLHEGDPEFLWVRMVGGAYLVVLVFLSHPLCAVLLLASIDAYYILKPQSEWVLPVLYTLPVATAGALAWGDRLIWMARTHSAALISIAALLRVGLLAGSVICLLPLYFEIGTPWTALLLTPWGLVVWASVPRTRSLLADLAVPVVGALLFVVILFAVLESGSRMVFRENLPNVTFNPHDERLVSLAPGSRAVFKVKDFQGPPFRVDISAQGIRDSVYAPKTPAEFRVLALGDSTTFGWGVNAEHSLPKQLESLVRERCATEAFSMVNAGTPTYGPWQSLSWMKQHGKAFQPNYVFYTLFPLNDPGNELYRVGANLRSYNMEWRMVERRMARAKEWPMQFERWVRLHSRLYQTLLRLDPEADGPIARVLYNLRALRQPSEEPLLPPEYGSPEMELNRVAWYPELETSIDLVMESIEAMRALCAEQGWGFGVCVLPSHPAVCQIAYDDQRWRTSWETVPFAECKETRVFEERLAQAGIPFLSVLDAFRAVEDPCLLHIPGDGHLSIEGNQLMAEEAARFLAASLPESLGCAAAD